MQDKKIFNLLKLEEKRQKEGIELIPSENYASAQVRKLLGSVFVNKYSEGYPGKRYYGGNQVVDQVEILAQERAKKLFKVPFVNVQPYSGSPANLAVYLAVCQPGDAVMGQALTAGGHLTHGHSVSATGIYYKTIQYGVDPTKPRLFDYETIKKTAIQYKPKLIWVGATAYPLKFEYEKFAEIADEVGAYLAADIAHVAGLIAGGVHPSPVKYVDIITTTTHKTLRGPRGAMIMVTEKGLKKDPDLPQKINKAVFPGLQGGPHDNQTAAIAASLDEASRSSFKKYAAQIVKNAKTLAKFLADGGLKLVGGGTENHLILVDLSETLGIGNGVFAEKALDLVNLTANKNTVPGEQSSPFYPSGIRLGTPAATTRGMKEKEMKIIGETILAVIEILKKSNLPVEKEEKKKILFSLIEKLEKNKEIVRLRAKIKKLALRFPLP
jgi:glycine hydroxymethyltransferase